MWSYYGSKTNLAWRYPAPVHDHIIEPFAGSAKYALKYFERQVTLVDKYPVIIEIWKWLQQCSEHDILSMPRYLPLGKTLSDLNFDCEAARNFYGFMIACADARPRNRSGSRKAIDRPNFTNFGLKRVASELFKIRHWEFICGDYSMINNEMATWFIDPPYVVGGECYPMSSKKIDYLKLAEWCKSREGQVIVCENTKADWLPFLPMTKQRGSLKTSVEAIWTNYHTHFNNLQTQLL